jgi:chromosome segregation ATPase
MAKKPPPKGKLLRLKPPVHQKGKVLQLKPSAKRSPTKKRRPLPPPPRVTEDTEERLRQAMEELQEARVELSRLGHAMTAAHRALVDEKFASEAAQSNLRAELAAVRTDLKTALAELEIARADRERLAAAAQRRIYELEHAVARLRAEMAELRPSMSTPAGATDPSEPLVPGRGKEPL